MLFCPYSSTQWVCGMLFGLPQGVLKRKGGGRGRTPSHSGWVRECCVCLLWLKTKGSSPALKDLHSRTMEVIDSFSRMRVLGCRVWVSVCVCVCVGEFVTTVWADMQRKTGREKERERGILIGLVPSHPYTWPTESYFYSQLFALTIFPHKIIIRKYLHTQNKSIFCFKGGDCL